MADVSVLNKVESSIYLPPGFRFHPTDEEIITHYVSPKVVNPSFSATAVGEVDLNKCEPWDLPSKANMGEKEWYFFYQKDRKYPTGMRTNRATEAGYWKATGKDKEIFRGKGVLVGMKKTLVFYRGRAPKGEKTNWVMHEFRLEGKTPQINLPRTSKDEWVVCRVFHKNMAMKKSSILEYLPDSPTLPPLMDPPFLNSNTRQGLSYVNNMVGLEELQDHNKKFLPNFSGFNHQVSQCNPPPSSALYTRFPDPSPNFPLRALAATNGASIAMRMNCKMEQFSTQSMVSASQDTGLSNDRNTEISSYDNIEVPTSAVQILDLDNIWKY